MGIKKDTLRGVFLFYNQFLKHNKMASSFELKLGETHITVTKFAFIQYY